MTLKEHFQIFRRAVKMALQMEKRYTICMMLCSFLDAVVVYIPVYFSAKVIDSLVNCAPLQEIFLYAALTVGLVFAVKLAGAVASSMRDVYQIGLYRNNEWAYSEKAMQMAYTSVEDPEVTRLKLRTKVESQTGFNWFYLFRCLNYTISNATKIVASVSLTVSFFALPSVPLWGKLALAAFLGLTLLVSIHSTAKMTDLDQRFWADSIEMNVLSEHYEKYTSEYDSGKDIRLYGMKDLLADRFLEIESKYYANYIKTTYKKALLSLPGIFMEYVLRYGVYGVLIFAALAGDVSVGSIAKYVSCIMLLVGAVTTMTSEVQRLFDNDSYLQRYFKYFDIPNEMYKGSLTVAKRDDNEYFVEFKNVSFRYPNTETWALKNVNLKFKIGEKLAIVGMNGSGKTTFIKLLCRLYDPTEGEILLNGVNIKKFDYDEYMSIFSVVFQDFQLFAFKLGEVVASNKNHDEDRVKECLRKANFGARLADLPDGLDTYLYKGYDKSGVEISGGEAQKIALARALYKDAPFILLDEPTAALDPVSEYEVYSDFNSISGDKTTVYISHRLASCRFCDKIAVFDSGKIVQTGTHESLFSDEAGKYHELWEAQAQYYTTEETVESDCP